MERENEAVENLFDETNSVENKMEEVTSVSPISDEMENPVEEVQDKTSSPVQEEKKENIDKEVLEHPNAKVTLQTEKDEHISKKELEELKDTKLMDNSSLKFVLILGVILMIVIFLIPMVSNYIGG